MTLSPSRASARHLLRFSIGPFRIMVSYSNNNSNDERQFNNVVNLYLDHHHCYAAALPLMLRNRSCNGRGSKTFAGHLRALALRALAQSEHQILLVESSFQRRASTRMNHGNTFTLVLFWFSDPIDRSRFPNPR